MKNMRRWTAALLAAMMLWIAVPLASAASFPDVRADAWYASDVSEVTERGLMQDDGHGLFWPESLAPRQTLAKALWYAAGSPEPVTASGFTDLADIESPWADWAAEAGIIKGYEDGTFRGGDAVTREQFAAMLWRAEGEPAAKRELSFADNGEISDYAKPAVAWAQDNGILRGLPNNLFDPKGTVTRAQAAAVLVRWARLAESELPLTGRLICIDPGHCVTPLTGKGYREQVSPFSKETKPLYTTGTQGAHMTEEKLNLIVGLKLRNRLEELGAEVVMTREVSEITISGIGRCEVANRVNADVAIRIHADGNDDKSVHGVSVMVPDGNLLGWPSIKDESVRLGRLMVDAVAAKTGAKNRGIMPRSDMTGFNYSKVPTVLIEMGFMTNPEEDAKLETDAYQNLIVEGIVESLFTWYGI